MIKKVTLLLICVLITVSSFAQNHASASQTVHIQVAPAIEILTNTLIEILKKWQQNHGNGGWPGPGGNGKSIQTGGNNIADQQIIVRSNKDFIVSVKTQDGTTNNVLLALVDNQTGGRVSQTFSNNYSPVGVTSQDLLSDCSFGNERSFAVNYKTRVQKAKEQPITKADIIYTATLP